MEVEKRKESNEPVVVKEHNAAIIFDEKGFEVILAKEDGKKPSVKIYNYIVAGIAMILKDKKSFDKLYNLINETLDELEKEQKENKEKLNEN